MKSKLCWNCLYEHPRGYRCGPFPPPPVVVEEDVEGGIKSLRQCLVDHRADEFGRFVDLRNRLIEIRAVLLSLEKDVKRQGRSLTKKFLEALGEKDSD